MLRAGRLVISRSGSLWDIQWKHCHFTKCICVPTNSLLFVKQGQKVFFKQLLAQINIYNDKKISSGTFRTINPIKSKFSGLTYIFNSSLWILSSCIINNKIFYKCFDRGFNFRIIKFKTNIIRKNFEKSINVFSSLSTGNITRVSFFNMKPKFLVSYVLEKLFSTKSVFSFNKKKTTKIISVLDNQRKLKPGDFILEKDKISPSLKSSFSAFVLQKDKDFIVIKKAFPFCVPKDSSIVVSNYFPVKRGQRLFDIKYQRKKTEDIVQGLPKVEEFLEAKKPSNSERDLDNPHLKLLEKFYFYKQKYSNEIAVKKSFNFIQKYLIEKVLSVYSIQGVDISYKHMEIIVKQMTSKVLIVDSFDSSLIVGEITDFSKIKFLNKKYSLEIKYEPILVGITKLSLMSQSFISQASFQETTKVLSRSAIEGKIDWLYGLKENLVLGNIIPAGTGFK